MKSSVSGILLYMFFCTHLVQIQASKLLQKKQCLSVFQFCFTICISRIQEKENYEKHKTEQKKAESTGDSDTNIDQRQLEKEKSENVR